MNKIVSLRQFFAAKVNEEAEAESLDIDTSVLDELVELVGSEEDVEDAAASAYDDLAKAYEKGEVEMSEEDVPENLAIASLVLKLVEMGSIDPQEADDFIAKHVG
jgi:ATP phosphoribosyltransferase regulatory subunit HisZ